MTDELTTLRQRLAEAEDTKHKLVLGNKRIRLMHSGGGTSSSADFATPEVEKVDAYIAQLKARIEALTCQDGGGHRAFSYF